MDITITVTDHAYAGLERVAAATSTTVHALCYATLIEVAGQGLRLAEATSDAALLTAIKAAKPDDTKATIIAASEVAADAEGVEPAGPGK